MGNIMQKKISIVCIISLLFVIVQAIWQVSYVQNKVKEEHAIETFFVESVNKKENVKKEKDVENIDYIAVLEIPAISLKKGLVPTNSKYNNIKYNIQILNNSINNDDLNDVYLAAHSGNSKVSFFKNLDKLNISDIAYLYYNKTIYKYMVDEIFEQNKDGTIIIPESKEKRLILTTCSKDKEKQLIIICKLIEEIK